MNFRNIDGIIPSARYSRSQAEREFGIAHGTWDNWRNKGLLVVLSTRRSMCTGQRLLEAIEKRLGV